MKLRTPGFLAQEHIDHDSEVFNYIAELHEYLWKFVRVANPGANGHLGNYVDASLETLQDLRGVTT